MKKQNKRNIKSNRKKIKQRSITTSSSNPFGPKVILGNTMDVQLEQQSRVISSQPNSVNCVERSLNNAEVFGLDYQWGSLLVFDEVNQQFESFYQSHHMWNVSKDGSVVYDDIDLINQAVKQYNFVCKDANEWNVKVIDGSKIKCNGSCYDAYWKVVDTLTPKYKGKCDAIYLTGFAVNAYVGATKNYTQKDIDMMVESFVEAE